MNDKSLIIDKIVKGYIDAMLWSSCGVSPTGDLIESLDNFEVSPQLKGEAWHICLNFYEDNEKDCLLFVDQYKSTYDLWECLGHDLWLTSVGHGVGFWDRGLGELGNRLTEACKPHIKDVYLGDDELVYLS